jgi:TolA-binding protein
MAGGALLANVAQAQTLGVVEQRLDNLEKAVRHIQKSETRRKLPRSSAEGSAPGDVSLQLDRRLGALERAVASLVSTQERDHRELVAGVEQLQRMKGDVESRLDAVESQARTVSVPVPQPVAAISEPVVMPLNADGRLQQAMDYVTHEDWAKAEFALDTFLANYPSDTRLAEARYQLGRAFQGQGKHAQAAQVFLDVYEKYPDAPFIVEDLLALGQALAALGPENTQQACDVYDEIDAIRGTALSVDQRSRLLDQRLALKCTK